MLDKEIEVGAAKASYDAYCKDIGGVGFNGDKLPGWEDVKPEIKQAWCASINGCLEYLVAQVKISLGTQNDILG